MAPVQTFSISFIKISPGRWAFKAKKDGKLVCDRTLEGDRNVAIRDGVFGFTLPPECVAMLPPVMSEPNLVIQLEVQSESKP